MKLYELKQMSTKDLLNTLKESYDALDNYRFQHASGQLENYKSIQNTKKTIARILTILKEREKLEKEQTK
ncbi:MAG: 50S ribosomal protein L29 [Ignavibacteria bacterium]|nr:50S ribosomal protein L29 [Ignavibacteria bacterium]